MRLTHQKKTLTIVCIFFFVICVSSSQGLAKKWVNISDAPKTKDGEPILKKVKSNKINLDIEVLTPGFYVSEHRENARIYHKLGLGKYHGDLAPGYPNLPVQRKFIYIPHGKTVKIKVELGKPVTLDDYLVFPVQKPQLDVKGAVDPGFFVDDSVYTSNGTFPSEQVFIEEVRNIRGHRIVLLHICPFSYTPSQRVLTVYPDMEIKIKFKGNSQKVDSRLASSHFDKFIKGIVINPEAFSEYGAKSSSNSLSSAAAVGAEFLIITDPDFSYAANNLSTHKQNLGMSTIVKTTNDTGTTSTTITNYIQDAFDNWIPAPSFVLLLGDAEFIPVHYRTIHPHPYQRIPIGTDLYYSTLSGTDYIPDIFLGRIPVNTPKEANTVVQKIINYETNPPGGSFSTSGAVAAYFQDDEDDYDGYSDRRFVRTAEEVRDFLLTKGYSIDRIYYTKPYWTPTNYNNGPYGDGEPLPPELLRSSGFAWDGDAADITASINSGIAFLLHRDHGMDRNDGYAHTGWEYPEYNEAHINGLSNDSLLPVVFSINCETGWFDGETDSYINLNYESFCELLLRKTGGGAVAVFGATRISYSGYNDFLAEGFFDCIWPEFLPEVPNNSGTSSRLGQMMNHGKLAMDTIWGDPLNRAKVEYEIFHVIGDPTLEMITSDQTTITYCALQGNDQSCGYIAGVGVGDLYNTSGPSGYSDFTSMTAYLIAGQTVDVSLTPGYPGNPCTGTECWKIWLDYNIDGDFEDAGEEVFSGYGESTVSGNFTVPSSAIGPTRMRVVMSHTCEFPACGTFPYGEVEDYTVNISEPGKGTVGNTDIFPDTSTSPNRRAMPFTMPENGTIESVTMYHDAGSGSMILGVYDGAGLPANRLGVTAATTVSSSTGWQTINLTSPAFVVGDSTVWLAWVYESNPGIAYQTGSPGRIDAGVGWSGGMPDPFGSSTQSNYIYSIYATYTPCAPPQYTLTTNTVGNGTVTLNPPGGTYDVGTVVTLNATPDSGWQFDNWSGDLSGSTNPTTITMNSNKSVTATFSEVGATGTVGNETVFGSTSTSAYRRAMPFTMPENGTITSVTMYHTGGSGNMILGVYDGASTPQNRLGVTPTTAVSGSTGWQTINLTGSAFVSGGATVWLAWVYESNPGTRYQTGSPGRYQSSQTWSGGMPDPFGSGSQTSYIYSIYATYNR